MRFGVVISSEWCVLDLMMERLIMILQRLFMCQFIVKVFYGTLLLPFLVVLVIAHMYVLYGNAIFLGDTSTRSVRWIYPSDSL